MIPCPGCYHQNPFCALKSSWVPVKWNPAWFVSMLDCSFRVWLHRTSSNWYLLNGAFLTPTQGKGNRRKLLHLSCGTWVPEYFRENPAIVKILGYATHWAWNQIIIYVLGSFFGACVIWFATSGIGEICGPACHVIRDCKWFWIWWRTNPGVFRFAGVTVCSRAFIKLTKISAGTLQNARNKIGQGVVQVWRADALSWMTMRNQSKAHRYLDARSWIEKAMRKLTVRSRPWASKSSYQPAEVFLPLSVWIWEDP